LRLCPITCWESSQRSPDLSTWILRVLLLRELRGENREKWEKNEEVRRAGK